MATLKESVDQVEITVEGFTVSSAMFDDEELADAAQEIASDIGMALAGLGTSAGGGKVTVRIFNREASSDE